MSDHLPRGWTIVQMNQVCSKVQDGTHFSPTQQSTVGDFKYITAKNIKIQGLDLSNVTYIPESVHRSIYDRCNPEKGDVLYIKDGATTGIATVNELDEEFSLLSSVALLKADRDIIDPYFLKWYLNSPIGFKTMTDQMTGSAITRLVLRTIRKSVVPLAPLNEQRRIVAKLERLLAKVDACQKRLDRIPLLLKRFRQAVLADACSGRLTADWRTEHCLPDSSGSVSSDFPGVPSSWKWRALKDFSSLRGGVTKGRKLSGMKTTQIPYLRVANVQDGYLDLSEVKTIEVLPSDIEKYSLHVGDVLFTEGGDRDKLGRGTIWKGEIKGCIHQNHIFRARVTDSSVRPEFLSLATKSQFSRQYFFENANQTVNLASMNLTTLSNLPVPLPPAEEQKEIVRRVNEMIQVVDQLEFRYAKAKAHVDKLTQSILAKAFRGELVPQLPNDEPASVLLERIKTKRNTVSASPEKARTPHRIK